MSGARIAARNTERCVKRASVRWSLLSAEMFSCVMAGAFFGLD